MIFLPPVRILPKKSIPIYHTKFVLGDNLYFIHDKDTENNWIMKRLDTRKFNISSVEVQFDEGIQARVPESNEGVFIKRDKAYFWNTRDNFLLEGRIDAECFHWRKIDASGPVPPFRSSFTFDDGSDNFLCAIAQGSGSETLSMYRLDLTTFLWTRQGMVILHKPLVDELRNFPPWIYGWSAFLANQQVHFIRFKGRSHVILDLTTLEWLIDEAMSPNNVHYTDGSHFYMLGKDKITPRSKSTISRYDSADMEWTQFAQISNVHTMDQSRYDSFKIGTRIVIVEGFRHGRNWVETVLQLELEPTLFDRAAIVLWRDRDRARLVRSLLPSVIVEELIARRVLTEDDEDMKGRQTKRQRAQSTPQKKAQTKKAKIAK